MQITAIILAGGKSKRMGTDKALLEINGTPLLEKSITLCKQVSDTILLSSNQSEHQSFGYPVIADEINNCGPIGGISSCLKKSTTEWNFVISVDAVFVETTFIQYLFSEIGNVDAIIPFSDKGNEPLIGLYNRNCLPVMAENIRNGDYKMQNLLRSVTAKFVDASEWVKRYPKLFHNLNSPGDLKVVHH